MPSTSVFRFGMLIFGAVLLAVAGCVATGQGADPTVEQAQASGQSLASFQRSLEQLRAGKLERALETRQRLAGRTGLRLFGTIGRLAHRDATSHRQQNGAKDQPAETKRRGWGHAYFWLIMSWKDGDIAFSLAKAASEIMSYPASLKCTPSV